MQRKYLKIDDAAYIIEISSDNSWVILIINGNFKCQLADEKEARHIIWRIEVEKYHIKNGRISDKEMKRYEKETEGFNILEKVPVITEEMFELTEIE